MGNATLCELPFHFFPKALKLARKEKEEEEMEKAAWQASGHNRERRLTAQSALPNSPPQAPLPLPGLWVPQALLSLSPRPLSLHTGRQ